jgi:hypothetical protein
MIKSIRLISIVPIDQSILIGESKSNAKSELLILKNWGIIPFFSRYIIYTIKLQDTKGPIVSTQTINVVNNMSTSFETSISKNDFIGFKNYHIKELISMELIPIGKIPFEVFMEFCTEYQKIENPWSSTNMEELTKAHYAKNVPKEQKYMHMYDMRNGTDELLVKFHYNFPTIIDQHNILKEWFPKINFKINFENKNILSNLNTKLGIRNIFLMCSKNPLWFTSYMPGLNHYDFAKQFAHNSKDFKNLGIDFLLPGNAVPLFQHSDQFKSCLNYFLRQGKMTKDQAYIYEIAYQVGFKISKHILNHWKRTGTHTLKFNISSFFDDVIQDIHKSSKEDINLEKIGPLLKYKVELILTNKSFYLDQSCKICNEVNSYELSPFIIDTFGYKLKEHHILEQFFQAKCREIIKNNSQSLDIIEIYSTEENNYNSLKALNGYYNRKNVIVISTNKISASKIKNLWGNVTILSINSILDRYDPDTSFDTFDILIFWQIQSYNTVMFFKTLFFFKNLKKIIGLKNGIYPCFPGIRYPGQDLYKIAKQKKSNYVVLKEISRDSPESKNLPQKQFDCKYLTLNELELYWDANYSKISLKRIAQKMKIVTLKPETCTLLNQKLQQSFIQYHFKKVFEKFKNPITKKQPIIFKESSKKLKNHLDQNLDIIQGYPYIIKKMFFYNIQSNKKHPIGPIHAIDFKSRSYFKKEIFIMDELFLKSHCLVMELEKSSIQVALNLENDLNPFLNPKVVIHAWCITMNQFKDINPKNILLYFPESREDLEKLPSELYLSMFKTPLHQLTVFTPNGSELDIPTSNQNPTNDTWMSIFDILLNYG